MESIPYRKSIGIISDQLIRSSGSVGANLSEADNGRSKKEFVGCIGISLREIKESIYWLKILRKTNNVFDNHILKLEVEASQICRIIGKIYWTVKNSIQK